MFLFRLTVGRDYIGPHCTVKCTRLRVLRAPGYSSSHLQVSANDPLTEDLDDGRNAVLLRLPPAGAPVVYPVGGEGRGSLWRL